MFKFNSDHIFTGQIKQLLKEFHLPKYRVYTKEQQKYHDWYTAPVNSEAQDGRLNLLRKFGNEPDGDGSLHKLASLEAELKRLNNIVPESKAETDELNWNKANIAWRISYLKQHIGEYNLQLLAIKEPELNVLSSVINNTYNVYPGTIPSINIKGGDTVNELYSRYLRYIPYIKDGIIQVYVNGEWLPQHQYYQGQETHEHVHNQNKSKLLVNKQFIYNTEDLNYTKQLKINNNIYDTYTHEYLGDYLRFQRDYNEVDLMPLYNCFSNSYCNKLDIKVKVAEDVVDADGKVIKKGYTALFNTDNTAYKIYKIPVKLFKAYTIAIDCEAAVEVCCGVYGAYQEKENSDSGRLAGLSKNTYVCYNSMNFTKPVLFDKLLKIGDMTHSHDLSELAQYEHDLKLYIKLPADLKSSIVVLEGDYTDFSGTVFKKDLAGKWQRTTNHVVYNSAHAEAFTDDEIRRPTPLQLLMLNTGESYPFADRLMEYLLGNAVTSVDHITDNIERAKTVIGTDKRADTSRLPLYNERNVKIGTIENPIRFEVDGIWSDELGAITYEYMNQYHNNIANNHDILGFIDKDVEKLYKFTTTKEQLDRWGNVLSTEKAVETIASVNIYPEWENQED